LFPRKVLLLSLTVVLALALIGTAGAQERGGRGGPSAAAPPFGCPDGWSEATRPLNWQIQCLPGNLAPPHSGDPTASLPPPFGCPDGWSPVDQDLNRAIRCLPDTIVPPGTGDPTAALPPPFGCPEGWSRVTRPLNWQIQCLPTHVVAEPPREP
jgi:hypothetical protein